MDRGIVGRPGNNAIERIDFANKVAFPQPPDCRVATHSADLPRVEGDQGHIQTHTGSDRGSLDPGMTSAYHNDIELCHERTSN